jgi:hypothetical protein
MSKAGNVVLMMKHNAYVGREYGAALKAADIDFFLVETGNHPLIDEMEAERTGGLWLPSPLSWNNVDTKLSLASLAAGDIACFIEKHDITLAIQGDVGEIISHEVISLFRDGILNFHPGDLPEYRGCSAPEWQLLHDKKIVCTCHLIDSSIDTGNIVDKFDIEPEMDSYENMRASIYPKISGFVVKTVSSYLEEGGLKSKPQGEGIYREYIGSKNMELIKQSFNKKVGSGENK